MNRYVILQNTRNGKSFTPSNIHSYRTDCHHELMRDIEENQLSLEPETRRQDIRAARQHIAEAGIQAAGRRPGLHKHNLD